MSSVINTKPAELYDNLVNFLDIPDDITVSSTIWTETDSALENPINSNRNRDWAEIPQPLIDLVKGSERLEIISEAIPDNPWIKMKEVWDTFPNDYLESLNRYQSATPESNQTSETSSLSMPRAKYYSHYPIEKLNQYFDEECNFFSENDPTLKSIKEACRVDSVDKADTDSTDDYWWRRSFSINEFSISPPTEYLLRAVTRAREYELPARHDHDERTMKWVEDNFLRRMENI